MQDTHSGHPAGTRAIGPGFCCSYNGCRLQTHPWGYRRAWPRGCSNACFDWSNFHNAGGTKTDILSATRNKRIPLRKRKAKWEFNCPLCNIRSKNNQAGGCGTPKKFGAYVCSFMKYWWVHNRGLVAWLCLVWLKWTDAQAKIKFCIKGNFSSLLFIFFMIWGE